MSVALAFALTLLPIVSPPPATSSTIVGPNAESGSHARRSRPSGPNLVARCLWAERGWRTVVLGLELDDPEARRVALIELEEHERLHGWVGELGDGLSWMISAPSICPPAALIELGDRDLSTDTLDRYPLYWRLARVFAETGHVDRALPFLDAIRMGEVDAHDLDYDVPDPRDGVALATARILQHAGRWEAALEALDRPPFRPVQPRRADDLVRMKSLLELGRIAELERLVVRELATSDDCAPLELLIDGWSRVGAPNGVDHLVGRVESRLGRPASEKLRTRIEALWAAATRHRGVLAMSPRYAGPQLTALLDRGDHRRDVLARFEAGGTDMVDDLLARLTALLGSSSLEDARKVYELVAVLAETGDPRVLPALESLGSDHPANPLARWRAANALRRDLAEERQR